MTGTSFVRPFFLMLSLLLAACSSDSQQDAPLKADNVNLIFVVSPDLANHTDGDIATDTANLSSQGLQRSLMMATYLKQQVLGGNNVTDIYTISPMSHLQTDNKYPDLTAIGYIQQFALLNQFTLNGFTANNFTINASYAEGAVPADDVATPQTFCPNCTGLHFSNAAGVNDTLAASIIDGKKAGYHVFSAPWETVSAMLTSINSTYGYNLSLPTSYKGSNYVYALSIPTSGQASLVTYNSNLNPSADYPTLPATVPSAACTHSLQPYYRLSLYNGMTGVTIPSNINTNARFYIVRHAEAHPDEPNHQFDNGNFVAAGQWRALSLASMLRGKIAPDSVYSIDPAGMWYQNGSDASTDNVSYVRPSLTVLPYAIANNLPYYLAAKLSLGNPYNPTELDVAQNTSDFFFFKHPDGSSFSNRTILVAWESGHVRPFLNALIRSYGANLPILDVNGPPVGGWPVTDYDTIWTVTFDAQGNLTIDNEMCEGIDSSGLSAVAPLF